MITRYSEKKLILSTSIVVLSIAQDKVGPPEDPIRAKRVGLRDQAKAKARIPLNNQFNDFFGQWALGTSDAEHRCSPDCRHFDTLEKCNATFLLPVIGITTAHRPDTMSSNLLSLPLVSFRATSYLSFYFCSATGCFLL